MSWLFELYRTNPPAQALAVLCLVCVLGMSLGSIQVRGIKLGTSGVFFAALVVGHFSKSISHETLDFVKEFGLILFVFCIGMQLGPGLFASLRHDGLRLNGLALAIVLSGAGTSVLLGWLFGVEGEAVLGIFSGATTNTPSLGAAQQTLASFPEKTPAQTALPALSYAVTYPLGVIGIIATLLILKLQFRVDVEKEVEAFESAQKSEIKPVTRRTLVVENPNLQGLAIREVPGLAESGVVISRIAHPGESVATAATRTTPLQVGDRILAVGVERGLDHIQRVVGRASNENLLADSTTISHRRILVTNSRVLGATINELNLDALYGVSVTRVVRGELEMTAVPQLRLQFGDTLHIVGPEVGLSRAAAQLGNSVSAVNETQFVSLFAGIGLGIAIGTYPISVPWLPQPLRLGLAGGPLIVALIVGRIGRLGRLVWHMPRNANLAFREFGISLFFASVGLMAGPRFFASAFSLSGLQWLLVGSLVTMLPLLAIAMFARKVLRMNYVVLCGLLAGSMTDPPALAFANTITRSESSALAYATVYPLTMLLRIVAAQVLAVLLC